MMSLLVYLDSKLSKLNTGLVSVGRSLVGLRLYASLAYSMTLEWSTVVVFNIATQSLLRNFLILSSIKCILGPGEANSHKD